MLKELDDLIERILLVYEDVSGQWVKSEKYLRVNLKKTCVSEIYKNDILLDLVLAYRGFILRNNQVKKFAFDPEKLGQDVNMRVKTQNSIEYKIENYIVNHEKGKVPIHKCLNDLAGIRFFISDHIIHEKIQKYIKEKFPQLKCIDASKNGYIATHVYFKRDNFSFLWELQIWRNKDKDNNLVSHKQYKQDYVKWECNSKRSM